MCVDKGEKQSHRKKDGEIKIQTGRVRHGGRQRDVDRDGYRQVCIYRYIDRYTH